MATLVDYYNTGADDYTTAYGTEWSGMTFTASASYSITSVKLFVYRVGSPGTITVSIRATSSGLPTGADLVSGTFNGNTLTDSTTGEWKEITLSSTALTNTTKYAIIIRATSGNVSNTLAIKADDTSPSYSGGSLISSYDSGSNWEATTAIDILFETYKTDAGPANIKSINGLAIASVKSVNGLAIASVKSINGLI